MVGRDPGTVGLGWKTPRRKARLLTKRDEGRGRSDAGNCFNGRYSGSGSPQISGGPALTW